MPWKTKHGTHYHERQSCPAIAGHDVEAVGNTAGLSPCQICCGGGNDTTGGGVGSGMAGGGSGAYQSVTSDDVQFLNDEEADAFLEAQSDGHAPGSQGSPLDSYDYDTDGMHVEALVGYGTSSVTHGTEAPEPRYGIVPEALASLDTLANFGIEKLPCPDRIPETWGDSEPSPQPLPTWDAPMSAPGKYWFYEVDSYSPNRSLSMQVAAAVEPAMERWPGATGEMMKYALDHGFMTAPASTCFHLSTPGGLACHSASVTACAIDMLEKPENEEIRKTLGPDWREITSVVCLWHDACKMDFYEPLDHPRTRPDGKVAYYGLAGSRQGDHRHGEISADIVRKFYGKALPEVAYQAIELHMGKFDHRYEPPKWALDMLDDDLQGRKAAAEAERRSNQDAEVTAGRIWWQLKRQVNDRRAIADGIRGKGDIEAAEIVARTKDPHAKRMGALAGRLRRMEQDESQNPLEQEYREEIKKMLQSYCMDGKDDATVALEILNDKRGHEDAALEARKQKALRVKEESESFRSRMEQIWKEHPFVRLIHEADAASAAQGR